MISSFILHEEIEAQTGDITHLCYVSSSARTGLQLSGLHLRTRPSLWGWIHTHVHSLALGKIQLHPALGKASCPQLARHLENPSFHVCLHFLPTLVLS